MIQWQQQIQSLKESSAFFNESRLANDAQGVWAVVGVNDGTLISMFGWGGNADLAGAVSWGLSSQIQGHNGWLSGDSPSIGLCRIGNLPPASVPAFGGAVSARLMVWAESTKLMYVAGVNRINGLTPQQFGTGVVPCVSVDAYATNHSAIPVVEVHQANLSYSQLSYRVGYMSAGPVNSSDPLATPATVKWNDSHPISAKVFGNSNGTNPAVVVAGGLVIVVFQGSKGHLGHLWCVVGKLNGDTIDWLSQENYSDGTNPSIGLTPTYFGQPYQNPAAIVETHTDSAGDATYRSGTWNNQSSPTSISWNGGDALMASGGCQPSVALDQNSSAGFIWLPQCQPGENLGWGLTRGF